MKTILLVVVKNGVPISHLMSTFRKTKKTKNREYKNALWIVFSRDRFLACKKMFSNNI